MQYYADDIQCYKASNPEGFSCLTEELNENLAAISEWIRNNGLKLNTAKTKLLRMSSRRCLSIDR